MDGANFLHLEFEQSKGENVKLHLSFVIIDLDKWLVGEEGIVLP